MITFRAYLSLHFGDIRFQGPVALTSDLRVRRLPEPALPCEAFEIMTRGVRGKDRLWDGCDRNTPVEEDGCLGFPCQARSAQTWISAAATSPWSSSSP